MRKRRRMGTVVTAAVLLLAAAILLLGGIRMRAQWNTELGKEGTQALQNPERGWYRMLGYEISDGQEIDWSQEKGFSQYAEEGLSLILLEINLKAYRDGEISGHGLETVRDLFDHFRQSRMKAIVRFLYDWDGYGKLTEPEDLSTVQRHMEQLGPLLQEYQDMIYTLQGVFVGSWAEMHTSKHLSRDNVQTLAQTLFDATGGGLFLSVRTPAYWRICTGRADPLEAGEAFQNTLAARLGLFNDGLLASVSDCGTYAANPQAPAGEYWELWGRDAELAFQEQLARYVPSGGESGLVNRYNTMEQMLQDLPRMRVSYLSGEFSDAVQQSWAGQTYTGEGPFSGMPFRDYLGAHLGYRFLVKDCTLHFSPVLRVSATLEIQVENTGFANLYHPKDVELLFVPEEGGEPVAFPLSTDVRSWAPGTVETLALTLRKGDLAEGGYKVYLKISEASASFAVQVANENAFDEKLEANLLGSFTVG